MLSYKAFTSANTSSKFNSSLSAFVIVKLFNLELFFGVNFTDISFLFVSQACKELTHAVTSTFPVETSYEVVLIESNVTGVHSAFPLRTFTAETVNECVSFDQAFSPNEAIISIVSDLPALIVNAGEIFNVASAEDFVIFLAEDTETQFMYN